MQKLLQWPLLARVCELPAPRPGRGREGGAGGWGPAPAAGDAAAAAPGNADWRLRAPRPRLSSPRRAAAAHPARPLRKRLRADAGVASSLSGLFCGFGEPGAARLPWSRPVPHSRVSHPPPQLGPEGPGREIRRRKPRNQVQGEKRETKGWISPLQFLETTSRGSREGEFDNHVSSPLDVAQALSGPWPRACLPSPACERRFYKLHFSFSSGVCLSPLPPLCSPLYFSSSLPSILSHPPSLPPVFPCTTPPLSSPPARTSVPQIRLNRTLHAVIGPPKAPLLFSSIIFFLLLPLPLPIRKPICIFKVCLSSPLSVFSTVLF